jgi:calcium-dependent protein kinase
MLLQILKHDWLVKEGVALTAELDSVVLQRMRQFAQMNKLKKMALMVVGQNLSPDELSGARHDGRENAKFKSAAGGISMM